MMPFARNNASYGSLHRIAWAIWWQQESARMYATVRGETENVFQVRDLADYAAACSTRARYHLFKLLNVEPD